MEEDPSYSVSASKLGFMFISTLLYELGHDSLVCYGKGALDTLQLGDFRGDAGQFIEVAFFGGVSFAEIEYEPSTRIVDIGLQKADNHYFLSES